MGWMSEDVQPAFLRLMNDMQLVALPGKNFASFLQMLYICDIKYMKKMETAITRTQTAFRLSTELLKRLKLEARKQNRSLNNFVESVLMDAVYRTPNARTMAAVKEARENENLETINLDNLEEFIESL